MSLLVINADRFGGHTPPPGHPERPERQDVMHVVAERRRERGATVAEPEPASREQILRVHTSSFVERLEATAGSAVMLDPDTFTSPESWDVTRLAAGAAAMAVDAVLDGAASRAAAWSGRRGITAARIAPADSACSTTSPWRPRRRWRGACPASR